MTSKAPFETIVVRKEEKEGTLKSFMTQALGLAAAGDRPVLGRSLSVVARSLESPVVKALIALRSEIQAAGLAVKAIVAIKEAPAGAIARAAEQGWTVRVLADHRFLEAHEQLVLSTDTCWIGDCMRRDPALRDAFESYCSSAPAGALHAAKSFLRLWSAAAPWPIGLAAAPEAACPTAVGPMLDAGGPTVATRQ